MKGRRWGLVGVRQGTGLVVAILLWLIPLTASTLYAADSGDSAIEAAARLIQQKQDAVNQKDRAAFLSVLNPAYPAYIEEQSRWFDDAIRWIDPGSYRLRLISVIPEREHQLRAWVEQGYRKDGRWHRVKFPLSLQETATGFKDSDVPFHHLTQGKVVIRYSDPAQREQAHIIQEAVSKAVTEFGRQLGWKPEGWIEIKMYHDPELFRQSVKPSLPRWAGGWHEAGQAIKLVEADSYADRRLLSSTVLHELTHRMVSDRSGDNAAYWLQEGAAEYYQSHLLPGLITEDEELLAPPRWSLQALEQVRLESLPPDQAADYYTQCGQLYRFIIHRFGPSAMQKVWSHLQLYPTIDRDGADKMKTLNQRTRTALEKVTGYTMKELERQWLKWLKEESEKGSQTPISMISQGLIS